MTVQEVRNKLIEFFCSNTCYDKASVLDCGESLNANSDLKGALVLEALRDLEGHKLIRKCMNEGCLFWVLEQPINSYQQNITISAVTASLVSDTINLYRASKHIDGDFSDKLKINEEDIQNLCIIVNTLLAK